MICSYLRPFAILGKLLSSLSAPSKSYLILVRPPLPCSAGNNTYPSHNGRRAHFWRAETWGYQRHRGAPLSPLLHRSQQRRDSSSYRIRQGNDHPGLFNSRRAQAVSIPSRLDAVAYLQHVLQCNLFPTLRLFGDWDRTHLQTQHFSAATGQQWKWSGEQLVVPSPARS